MTSRAAALLAALSLAGCGAQQPVLLMGPERDRVELTNEAIERLATILRLEDHRAFEPDLFRQLAAEPTPEIRRRAATAAGRIGDPAAVPFLIDVLARDPSPDVRADAAFALGLLGDTSRAVIAALRQAAPRDWTPVRAGEGTVVVEVVGALGRIGTDAARAEVVDVLRRVQRADDPIARRIAAEALLAIWKFPTGQGRTLSALRFADHPDPELRWRAALALVRLGGTDATPRLLALMGDPDPLVRSLAARGLTASAIDSVDLAVPAITALSEALQDPHPHVRINALRALGTFEERAPEAAILERVRDPDPNVAVAAAAALGALGGQAAVTLAAVVDDEGAAFPTRAAALSALAAVDAHAALAAITTWVDGDEPRRYAAARALAPLGWAQAGPLVRILADDASPRVAVAATQAAASAAAGTDLAATVVGDLRDVLMRAARVGGPRQRAVALRGVEPLLHPDDLGAVLAAYEQAALDPAARPAAIAAVRALAALEAARPGAAAAFFERFQPTDDRWVRRAVADALGDRWGAPEAIASEDPAFYLDLVRRYVVPALTHGARPEATVRTPHGDIRIELLADEAPLTVHNFMTLAEAGYYDDGVWHRVVPNFVLQDGAPAGDPSGGPGWTIRDELNRVRYGRGVVGMALSGPDTGGSQWFITHSPQPHLDAGYTAFGRVSGGERAMDRVVQGDPVSSVRIRH
jgi:cyclophilin family peptidyl-prolyl cis-trans isomerase/HEAT repeat protein